MSSFFGKVQAMGSKVGAQAAQFGTQVVAEAQAGSTKAMTGFKLENETLKAARILQAFLADPHHPESALNAIPKEVLARAKGLAIFTVLKAGFVWSGKAGSGVVIARLPDGTWSAPSCIATGGVGFGLQIGADLSEFVVVLNSDEALAAFAKGGNVTIGGQLCVPPHPRSSARRTGSLADPILFLRAAAPRRALSASAVPSTRPCSARRQCSPTRRAAACSRASRSRARR